MKEDRKQVKLTMSAEMYEQLQQRSAAMSISVPAMCCYFIGEKLAQLKLAEGAGIAAINDLADSMAKQGKPL